MNRIFIVFFCYFFTRLFNLLSLPIFNDESIYLHWGQIMVDIPNQAFFSLFDGKPPLILWNYGIFQKLPIDPLLVGRFVSILFGFITLLGIVEICRLLKISPKTQFIAGLLYVFNPLALFFDRLAILDSPVSTVFVWVLYFSLIISRSKKLDCKQALLLGFIQGLGLWIKGTCRLFLFLPFILPVLTLIFEKDKQKAGREVVSFFLSFLIAQILFLPIRLNPLFSSFSKKESDFLLPFSQIFSIQNLSSHLSSTILTFLIFITPFVLLIAILGFYNLFKTDKKIFWIFLLFFLIPLGFEIITAKYFLSRYYLFTFLPILILCAIGFEKIKSRVYFLLTISLLLPFILSVFIVLNPLSTLKTISQNKILAQDLEQYFTGWTSGYGVKETADFLTQQAKEKKIIVVVRADSGNPEDAMFVYLGKNKNIILASANRKPTTEELKSIQNFPIFFVSRGTQYLNMENMLKEVKILKKPFGNEFVGVYNIMY